MVYFGWGLNGLKALQEFCDLIVIFDVLSFSTCVDIVISQAAIVYPFTYKDDRPKSFADSIGAILAEQRNKNKYSLSLQSLLSIK